MRQDFLWNTREGRSSPQSWLVFTRPPSVVKGTEGQPVRASLDNLSDGGRVNFFLRLGEGT